MNNYHTSFIFEGGILVFLVHCGSTRVCALSKWITAETDLSFYGSDALISFNLQVIFVFVNRFQTYFKHVMLLLCLCFLTDSCLLAWAVSHFSKRKKTMADTVSDDQKFCLKEVLDAFRLCLSENREVYLQHYVAGWRGLIKFLNTLGSVFGFISKDAVTKIQILVHLLNGENGSQYVTIQSMVKYEQGNELVDLTKRGNNQESGCRTLLRLHRALRWLELFLDRLRTSSEDGKTSVMCADAYNESLAKYHPWVIRKAAGMAFCLLPGRQAFLEIMNVGSSEQVVAMLGEAIPLISEVYQITEVLYAQHNMLDLP
uniref:Ceramide-1-phosphate transfer protein n=2 Tax=Neogobius melanostomus TaxID=47308 RepID=A0A8C6U260_9GOBI